MNQEEQDSGNKVEASAGERWAKVREKLEQARAAHVQSQEMSGEEVRRALKKRARVLAAKPKEDDGADADTLEVVEFLLAHEHYAIELSCIREVYPFRECTAIPCTPSFVVGVINVRSRILSVVDLREFFDLPFKPATEHSRVIILSGGDMEFGVLADELLGVDSVPMDAIQPSLPTLTGVRAQYLKGVTSKGLVILDGRSILQDKRIQVNQEVD